MGGARRRQPRWHGYAISYPSAGAKAPSPWPALPVGKSSRYRCEDATRPMAWTLARATQGRVRGMRPWRKFGPLGRFFLQGSQSVVPMSGARTRARKAVCSTWGWSISADLHQLRNDTIFVLLVFVRVGRKGLRPTEPFGSTHAWGARLAPGHRCWRIGG